MISKKELLDLTGISYGQLYRWKRKQLIPEEWFIRKSTYTGQETFFPKMLVLARVQNILNMKDDLSLDELASRLSDTAGFSDLRLTAKTISERNIVTDLTLSTYGADVRDKDGMYAFDKVLHLVAVDTLLASGDMNLDEGRLLLRTLDRHADELKGRPSDLYFVRKMGVALFMLAPSPAELFFDEGVRLVSKVALGDLIEQLKGRLS
ncbi:YhbD family protein [Paenibacillus sabinae]|uniref:YhbD family protein n=1 Tax=Paenibacillus sabinae TaxID=365617 RepID=UPI0030846500